jgi:excinuclease UvrABC ATPase subunit
MREGGRIYVTDEPTTGLHPLDVRRLIALLNKMVDAGNTMIVIEHNLAVIAQADYIIDMGPGAGREGGEIIAHGTPARILDDSRSVTGPFLRRYALPLHVELQTRHYQATAFPA